MRCSPSGCQAIVVQTFSWALILNVGPVGLRISHRSTTPCSVPQANTNPSLGDHWTFRTPSALHLKACTERKLKPVRVWIGTRISKHRTNPSWLPDKSHVPRWGLISSVLIWRESSRICIMSRFDGPPTTLELIVVRSYWNILPLAHPVNILALPCTDPHLTSFIDSWSATDDGALVRRVCGAVIIARRSTPSLTVTPSRVTVRSI